MVPALQKGVADCGITGTSPASYALMLIAFPDIAPWLPSLVYR